MATMIDHFNLLVRAYDFKSAYTQALSIFKFNKEFKWNFISIYMLYLSIIKYPSDKDQQDLNLCFMFLNKLIKDLKIEDDKSAMSS